MAKYYIKLNKKRCIGCHGCEVHCKTAKDIPFNVFLCKIIEKDDSFKFITCHHCKKPKCIEECPTGAMSKTITGGLIYVDSKLCDGCGHCVSACPWDVPVIYERKAYKCNLCRERLQMDLEPACVTGCTTSALKLVELK